MLESSCLKLPDMSNGTEHFLKCEQLLEYPNYLLLRCIWWSKSNLYLKVVHFFNTSVNWTAVTAQDSWFSA